jgi:hypothetical protein
VPTAPTTAGGLSEQQEKNPERHRTHSASDPAGPHRWGHLSRVGELPRRRRMSNIMRHDHRRSRRSHGGGSHAAHQPRLAERAGETR